MKRNHILLLPLFFAIACTKPSFDIKMNDLFSDGMVLQQNEDVAIWGKYGPNRELTLVGSWGEETTADTDDQGKWMTTIKTPEAGGPYSLILKSGVDADTIDNVLIGEVWLASGQSNMEMPVKGWPPNDPIDNSEEEIAAANFPEIRMINVSRRTSQVPLDSLEGSWAPASPETVGEFSATAYFFARKLHQELGIPVGIIHSSWGGTVSEAWTSSERLRELGDFDEALDEMSDFDSEAVTAWFEGAPAIAIPTDVAGWDSVSFNAMEANSQEFDDTGWDTVELPGRFDQLPNGQYDGATWLRRTFTVDDPNKDYRLEIGSIDDMDATYINGQKIGGLAGPGQWNVKREYEIPASLLVEGNNTISIRAIDTGGPGTVNGPIKLISANSEIDLAGEWKSRMVSEVYNGKFVVYDLNTDMTDRPNVLRIHANVPTALFNGMINPLVPYSLKGAIWYQGESNAQRASQYKYLFPALIEDWRDQWQSNFPFYFVQIAPFNYTNDPSLERSMELRDAQRQALSTPNTGMVVTLDIANNYNIHPGNKQDVGKRLANWALAQDYGMDRVYSGPLYREHSSGDGKIVVTFDHVGSGLQAAESGLSGFEVAGEDSIYKVARAVIEDGKLVVSSSEVTNPIHVRYAWRDKGEATLFNKDGLPASSFSSDF